MTRKQRRKTLVRVAASVAALSPVALGSAAAAAPPPGETPNDGFEIQDTEHYAITYYHQGVKLGSVAFASYGEHLYACDQHRDGEGVSASLTYWDGGTQYKPIVRDPNGSKPGCGHYNLDIDENTPARLGICVGFVGCEYIDVVT